MDGPADGRTDGLVIAHNITPGMADPHFIEAITTNPDLESVVRSGVSLTLKKRQRRRKN